MQITVIKRWQGEASREGCNDPNWKPATGRQLNLSDGRVLRRSVRGGTPEWRLKELDIWEREALHREKITMTTEYVVRDDAGRPVPFGVCEVYEILPDGSRGRLVMKLLADEQGRLSADSPEANRDAE